MRSWLTKPEKAAYLFILPSILILFFFTIIPVVSAIGISFYDMNMFFHNTRFVGIENYTKMLKDPRVWNSLKNTFIFVLFEVPIQVSVGLLIASMLSKNTRINKIMRATYFIPVICSLTSISIIWSLILDPNIGIIPYYCKQLNIGSPKFLKDPNMAMSVIIFLTVWKNFGHTMVILLAGIQGINSAYYEAADVEGAGSVSKFTKITIPLLIPNIAFCFITNLIGSMQIFDQVYVATRGGPLFRTETIVQYIYSRGFTSPFQLGYASSIAVMLFIIIMTMSLTLNRWFLRKEEAIYE